MTIRKRRLIKKSYVDHKIFLQVRPNERFMKLGIEGTVGDGIRGDIAIDDIVITNQECGKKQLCFSVHFIALSQMLQQLRVVSKQANCVDSFWHAI